MWEAADVLPLLKRGDIDTPGVPPYLQTEILESQEHAR